MFNWINNLSNYTTFKYVPDDPRLLLVEWCVEPCNIIIPMDVFLSHIHIKLLNRNSYCHKSSTRSHRTTTCATLLDQFVTLKSMLCRSGSILHTDGIFCLRPNCLSTLSRWCHLPICKHTRGLMVHHISWSFLQKFSKLSITFL